MEVSRAIRALASQLRPPSRQPLFLMQGVVVSIETTRCTVLAQGGKTPVAGWKWIRDAYVATVGDVVWIIDGGPGQRFILGAINN